MRTVPSQRSTYIQPSQGQRGPSDDDDDDDDDDSISGLSAIETEPEFKLLLPLAAAI